MVDFLLINVDNCGTIPGNFWQLPLSYTNPDPAVVVAATLGHLRLSNCGPIYSGDCSARCSAPQVAGSYQVVRIQDVRDY